MIYVKAYDGVLLRRRLNALSDALLSHGGSREAADAFVLVRDESSRLMRTIINFTPPLGPGGRAAGARKAGEDAIRKELASLFSQAGKPLIERVVSENGYNNVRAFTTNQEGQPIPLLWDNVNPAGDNMAGWHHRFQNRSGKIRKVKQQIGQWRARVVVPEGSRDPYVESVVKRVGRWKATIALALAAIGEKVPAWLRKHLGDVRGIAILDVSKLSHPTSPEITFGTRAPGVGQPSRRYQSRVSAAVQSRARSMARRARLIRNNYCREITEGRDPRPCAASTISERKESIE